MAIYDTEEEQVEAVKRWWKENSQSVIIGVIVGVGLIFGVNFWKSQQHEKMVQASLMYENLMTADTQGKADDVDKLAQSLGLQYGSTAYAGYAALFQAKAKVQQGDIPAAKAILEKTIATADDSLKNVAKIRLINLMLATGEYEQGLKRISETDASSMQGFSSNYEELKGDLYVALNRIEEARTAYEAALREGGASPLLQFKLDDITASPVKPPAMGDNSAPTAAPVSAATSTPAAEPAADKK
ncbi:MAG: tetratricopeptide repeat protein [Methylococcales bacterium]|nr:tetratricopeptide repeat protein [Methylococcales bacterium]